MSVRLLRLPAGIAGIVGLERAEAEARPASEPFGRRAVAQDQSTDRPRVVARLERLGQRPEAPVAHVDIDARVGEEVLRPMRIVPGGDEDRAIRLVDETDRCRPRPTRPATAGRDPRDFALEDELGADVVRARLRQRDRCQDLPSVWVDGA
jgi:hypothetical protein